MKNTGKGNYIGESGTDFHFQSSLSSAQILTLHLIKNYLRKMKPIISVTALIIFRLLQIPFSSCTLNPDLEFTDLEKVALEKVQCFFPS